MAYDGHSLYDFMARTEHPDIRIDYERVFAAFNIAAFDRDLRPALGAAVTGRNTWCIGRRPSPFQAGIELRVIGPTDSLSGIL